MTDGLLSNSIFATYSNLRYAYISNIHDVQGGPPKLSQFGFLQFSINTEATLMCNKSYERKFCWLLGDIFKNCEKLSYGAEFAFFWQVAELANNPITRYW